jgi:hypothetical protein
MNTSLTRNAQSEETNANAEKKTKTQMPNAHKNTHKRQCSPLKKTQK